MTDEEQQKLNARWRSTPAMRARIRELSRPDSDDYDKAVIAVLDDFEAVLTQSACAYLCHTCRGCKTTRRQGARNEPAESKSMTKTVTDAMVKAAYEAYWDAPDDVEDHASMRIALWAALAQSDAEPVAATSRSLLKSANQKPTICYCKPGECSAPKPEWCIGRRYADGFREADFHEGGRYHSLWLELIRMILEWEDGHETASDLAKRVIMWVHDRKNTGPNPNPPK